MCLLSLRPARHRMQKMIEVETKLTNFHLMTKQYPKLIRGLRSLPGGNSQYLETMTAILTWIDAAETPTRENCLAWIEKTYSASRGVLTDYLQLLVRLGMVARPKTTELRLTEFGQEVLH